MKIMEYEMGKERETLLPSYSQRAVSELLLLYKDMGLTKPGDMAFIRTDEKEYMVEEKEAQQDGYFYGPRFPSTTTWSQNEFLPASEWLKHVFVQRSWDWPGYSAEENLEWESTMFLGVDEEGRRWCRWLIGEKVWIGWINPKGMKRFGKKED